jgi:hypothetical protein
MSKFAYWKLSALVFVAQIIINFKPVFDFGLMCSGGQGGHCGG